MGENERSHPARLPTAAGMYRRGSHWDPTKTLGEQQRVREHIGHVIRLIGDGIALYAGPFHSGTDRVEDQMIGLVIFTCGLDQARKEMSQDPAVVAGIFAAEVHPWYP